MPREISEEILEHYISITRKALDKVRIAAPENSHLYPVAHDFLNMAHSYFQDALHFRKIGDYPRALGAVYYAHAWLDAGARLGLFDVGNDHNLFTLAR